MNASTAIGVVLFVATGATWRCSWGQAKTIPPGHGHTFAADDEVDRLWADVFRAYRTGPVAERINVRVAQPPPPDSCGPVLDRTSTAEVRVWRGAGADPRMLRASLGPLNVFARAQDLIVVRDDDPSVCVVRRLGSPVNAASLATALPPLAFPAVELALGDDSAPANLTPYTRSVRWRMDEAAPRDPRIIRLVGEAAGGRAEVDIDRETSRVQRLTFRADSGALLEVRCEPIDAGSPLSWAIEPGDRRVVRSIRDLGAPEPELLRGDPVPDLPLHDLATDLWDLRAEFERRAGANPHAVPAPAILVLARQRAAGSSEEAVTGTNAAEGVRLFLRGLRRRAAEQGDIAALAGIPFWKPVLILEVGDFSRDKVSTANEAWNAVRPAKASPFDDTEPACLWSSAGRPLLDRFARGADTVIAVVAPDCTLMGVVAVKPSDQAEAVRARLGAIFAADALDLSRPLPRGD